MLRRIIRCGSFIATLLVLAPFSFTTECKVQSQHLPQWNRRDQKTAWTVLSLPNTKNKALFSVDGFMQPMNTGPAAKISVYDPATCATMSLTYPETKFSLEEDYLPIVRAEKNLPGFTLRQTLFVAPYEHFESGALMTAFSLTNKTENPMTLRLQVFVTPWSIYPSTVYKDRWYAANAHAVLVDGRLFLWSKEAIAAIPAETRDGITVEIPFSVAAGETREFTFALPVVGTGRRIQDETKFFRYSSYDLKHLETSDLWKERLEKINLPDPRYTTIARAQAAQLLMTLVDGTPHGGPTKYNSAWVRDNTFMIKALLAVGEIDAAKTALQAVHAAQLPSGEIAPIIGWDNKMPQDTQSEWDSQGEAIEQVWSVYSATEDKDILRKYFPLVKKAALFQERLMARDTYGIFPPSWSAEDIGPETQRHIWDPGWGIRGFKVAADIADELQYRTWGERFQHDKDRLDRNTRNYIGHIRKKTGIDYIPNNEEDVTSSSMARGSSTLLWPTMAFSPDDPLIRRSFDVYWEKWIAPSGGGFVHTPEKRFWPYAGLILAHDYLILGQRDRAVTILEWTLNHQTIPGLYVWGEDIDPITLLAGAGDMPHPTTAAEIINLLYALSK